MSYDIDLLDPVTREVIQLDYPHQMCGGTYALGGTREATLNITYNYAEVFRRVFGENGVRSIYGKTGAETMGIFSRAMLELGDDVDDDYWKPTEGNVKRAIAALMALASLRPDGIWDGD